MFTTPIATIHASEEDRIALARVASRLTLPLPDAFDFSSTIVTKPWGYEYLLLANGVVAVWVLYIRAGHETSMHCHPNKKSSLVVLQGCVRCSTLLTSRERSIGQGMLLHKGVFHQTRALTEPGALIMEVETPPNKHDLVRLRDEYGRVGAGYETPDRYSADRNLEHVVSLALSRSRGYEKKRLGTCDMSAAHLSLRTSGDRSRLARLGDSDLICLLEGNLADESGGAILNHGETVAAGTIHARLSRRMRGEADILLLENFPRSAAAHAARAAALADGGDDRPAAFLAPHP